MDSCVLFRNFTRMTASDFELLLQLIGPSIKKQDINMREAIPISTRLAVTLRFLATGDSYHTVMYISYITANNIDHHTRSVPSCHKVTERICGGK